MKDAQNEFMQHELRLPELTVRGMLLGAILTIIFTASNVYLGLKVGLTFSSAIPAAVISMAILKMAKDANILENNMVQTQASAAGTLSAIIFIIPGMLMIGYWHGFQFWQTLVVSACGGCLGVLFTIPLRRAMVVHSDLAYPEGVAAAEILKVGSQTKADGKTESGLKEILAGSAVASVVAFLTNGLQVLGGALSAWFHVGRGMTQLPLGYSTALVGAGYLIGIASGLAMLVGILIAWAGFVPFYTITSTPPDGVTMQKFAVAVYQERVRLIGAGAMGVAAAAPDVAVTADVWRCCASAWVISFEMLALGSRARAVSSTTRWTGWNAASSSRRSIVSLSRWMRMRANPSPVEMVRVSPLKSSTSQLLSIAMVAGCMFVASMRVRASAQSSCPSSLAMYSLSARLVA